METMTPTARARISFLAMAGNNMALENETVRGLRDEFERRVLETIPDTQVNGDREHRLPNTTNIVFEGIDSEAVLMLLDQAGVCCSAGSACTTGSVHPVESFRSG